MGVSCQLLNIRDKIREVDDFITPDRQATVGEAHPELVFPKLNNEVRLEPPARPQAAVQAARALTPAPARSRILALRIQNEVNPTPYWRAPKPSLPIVSHLMGRQGAVQDKARVFADSDVGQNTSIVGKRGSPVMQSQR